MDADEKRLRQVKQNTQEHFISAEAFKLLIILIIASLSLCDAAVHPLLCPLVFGAGLFLFIFVSAKLGLAARCRLFALVLGVLCTHAMLLFIESDKSLIFLILYAFIVYALCCFLKVKSARPVPAASAALGILFALFVFIGSQLDRFGRLEILYADMSSRSSVHILVYCVRFSSLALFFASALNAAFAYLLKHQHFALRVDELSGKKAPKLYVIALTIFICWMPYFIAFFPGITSFDSLVEIEQQLGMRVLSNHHPIMHQLFIGLFLAIGRLFDSMTVGLALFYAAQMLFMAFVFAACIVYLRREGAGVWLLRAVFLIYALFTVYPFFSITMWKDVPFGAFTLLLMMLLLRGIKGEALTPRQSILYTAELILVSFLFCTFRNNGWYAFLLGFPLVILCCKKNRKRFAAVFLLTVTLVTGYQHIIFDGLNIEKPRTAEALSVPLQQLARVVTLHGDQLDGDTLEILDELFIDMDAIPEKYNPTLSDDIKDPHLFRSEAFDANPSRYVKLWLELGLRYTKEYVDAFLMQCYGYWYPDVTYTIAHYAIPGNSFGLQFIEALQPLRYILTQLHLTLSQNLPTAILYSAGLPVWLLLICAALLLLKGQGRMASPMFILAGLWLTTLASPVYCEYRYVFGLITVLPLFVPLALGADNKKISPREKENDENG